MRILLAYRSDVDLSGGAAMMMNDLGDALRGLGHDVDVSLELRPEVAGYDVVNVINMWSPETAIEQLRHLAQQPVPVVLTPIYSHWAEVAWARPSVLGVYGLPEGPERRRWLQAFSAGELQLPNGFTRWRFNEIMPGFHGAVREMLGLVDHLLVFSHREMQAMTQVTRSVETSYTVVPHGVVVDVVQAASPTAFREHTGIEGEFVLSVGTVNGHKNQLMLVEALRGTGLKLVLVGRNFEPEYLAHCLREGGEDVVHLEFLPREVVASAYKAAAVHAQTSFAEGAAQVNFEAAVAGCPIVVSNRSSEFEYFGDAPWYCDPTDPESIRAAVLAARGARTREPERLAACAVRIAEQTWERAALRVLEGYERAVGAHRRGEAIRARDRLGVSARATAVLALLEELEREPGLLADYAQAVDPDAAMTLLISADEPDDEALARRAATLAEAAALADECADMVVLRLDHDALPELGAAFDYVYGREAAAALPGAKQLELPPLREAA